MRVSQASSQVRDLPVTVSTVGLNLRPSFLTSWGYAWGYEHLGLGDQERQAQRNRAQARALGGVFQ